MLIGDYFWRNGVFPIGTDTLSPREKGDFCKLPAVQVHTSSDCWNGNVFISRYTIFDPSGNENHNFCKWSLIMPMNLVDTYALMMDYWHKKYNLIIINIICFVYII